MNIFIKSYDTNSSSAILLKDALGARICRNGPESTLKKNPSNMIVCWGLAPDDIASFGRVINHPSVVRRATNKVRTLRYLDAANVRTPQWTTNLRDATLMNAQTALVCRRVLTGKDGEGITIAAQGAGNLSELDKLWTALIPKQDEYRIHVVNGQVVDSMKKLRERGARSNPIQTTSNGYFFQKTGVVAPECVKQEALKAIRALDLDFGGVDVIHSTDGNAYVLEVNSAPELGSNTVRPFAAGIRDIIARMTGG